MTKRIENMLPDMKNLRSIGQNQI